MLPCDITTTGLLNVNFPWALCISEIIQQVLHFILQCRNISQIIKINLQNGTVSTCFFLVFYLQIVPKRVICTLHSIRALSLPVKLKNRLHAHPDWQCLSLHSIIMSYIYILFACLFMLKALILWPYTKDTVSILLLHICQNHKQMINEWIKLSLRCETSHTKLRSVTKQGFIIYCGATEVGSWIQCGWQRQSVFAD